MLETMTSHKSKTSIKALVILTTVTLLGIQNASARLSDAIVNFYGTVPNSDSSFDPVPAKLSLTGLYENISTKARTVTSGITAYEVNTPLWTDGAHKERFITIPVGTKVVATDTDQYVYPNKTVFIKNFMTDTVVGDTTSRIIVETRFLIVNPDSQIKITGLSYRWRRDQTDADLINPDQGLREDITVKVSGQLRGKRWIFPKQNDCYGCHKGRGVLGFITPQLNRPSKANASINQLQSFLTGNILSNNPLTGKTGVPFRWVGLTETGLTPPTGVASVQEWKVRSYFAANCSHCHGNHVTLEGAAHKFDFLTANKNIIAYDSAIAEGPGYVGRPAYSDPLFPQLVFKGYPESSYVMRRMMARGTKFGGGAQMPPIATYQIDSAAVLAVKDWICSLGNRGSACMLPAAQVDSTFWFTGIDDHIHTMRSNPKLNASLQNQVLTVSGEVSERPILYDFQGRKYRLVGLGHGKYRIESAIRTGVYFVKSGRYQTRVNLIQ
jgi:hypothetical protein